MKQKISKLMDDDHIIKQFAENIRPLNLVQSFLYARCILSKRNSRGVRELLWKTVESKDVSSLWFHR